MPTPAERLSDALATLTRLDSDGARIPTVTELCRLAAVSRNSLYRYHRDTLEALHQHRRQRYTQLARGVSTETQAHQAELKSTRDQLQKVVALVDHYYVAFHEARAMSERREREIADLRRRLEEKTTRIRR